MNPEVRPYDNGSSEPNALFLHVYPDPSGGSELLAMLDWRRIYAEDGKLKIVTLVDKEPVESYEFALEETIRYAEERSIPVIYQRNDAA